MRAFLRRYRSFSIGAGATAQELQTSERQAREFLLGIESLGLIEPAETPLPDNEVDFVLWPRTEIFRALRARARALSLHEWNQVVQMPGVRYRILLGDRERIASLIAGGECVDG